MRTQVMTCDLSDMQRRLWISHQLDGMSPQYCVPMTFKMSGEKFCYDKFLNACRYLLNKYAILRCSVSVISGKPMLQVTDSLDIREIYLPDMEEKEKEKVVNEIFLKEVRNGFELDNGPLSRFVLIRTQQHECFVLLLIHHIITDGWSNQILIRELFEFYQSDANDWSSDQQIDLETYRLFVEEEHKFITSEASSECRKFWKEQLEGYQGPYPMLESSIRPRTVLHDGAEIQFQLPKRCSNELKKLCKRTGATPFIVTLSAYMILISRYTGESDIAVGSPVANRLDERFENAVGLFMNTVVIRHSVNENLPYLTFLSSLMEKAWDVYANQQLPFGQVLESLNLKRDFRKDPFIQNMFVWGMMSDYKIPHIDGVMEPYRFSPGTSKFDITMAMEEIDGILKGSIEYSPHLFKRELMEQFARHYARLLASILHNPENLIKKIDMFSIREKKKLLRWELKKQNPFFVHQLVKQKSLQYPDQIAVIEGQNFLTYGELDRRSDQLSKVIRTKGIKKNDIVGIYLPRSANYVVAAMAVLKAGAAFLPLDPDYPVERLRFFIEDSNLTWIVTDRNQNDLLSDNVSMIYIDEKMEGTFTIYEPTLEGEDLAYVIYTSGSTGRPKGVMVKHKSLSNLITVASKDFGIKPGMRVSQFVSINFDVFILELFVTLTSGATIYMIDKKYGVEINSLCNYLEANRIQVVNFPMSILDQMKGRSWPSLEVVCTGGERCLPGVAEYWSKSKTFINIYGPAETTIAATWFKARDLPSGLTEIPIGKSIPNVKVYVLDKYMNLCPPGTVGEIYIGGIGLSKGYLHDQGERFVANPFAKQDSQELLYRTGDYGLYDTTGNLIFRGRKDDQVKVNGYRVELGEIENLLMEIECVNEAVVTVRKNESGNNQYLVAHIVLNTQANETIKNHIRDQLKKMLPPYMVPSHYDFIEEMPLTPNGKVDRNALSNRKIGLGYQTRRRPESEIEQKLLEIWAKIFECLEEEISTESDFFELGGHSLLIPLMVNEISNTFGVNVSLKDFIEYSTIKSLASYLLKIMNYASIRGGNDIDT